MASLADILPYAQHFARTTRVAQVVWRSRAVDTYGRTPLPEWNSKHAWRANAPQVVKIVYPAEVR